MISTFAEQNPRIHKTGGLNIILSKFSIYPFQENLVVEL